MKRDWYDSAYCEYIKQKKAGDEAGIYSWAKLELAQQILNLLDLAEGCPKHPGYKGKLQPRTDCGGCKRVYAARQNLQLTAYIENLFELSTLEVNRMREELLKVLDMLSAYDGMQNVTDALSYVLMYLGEE